jgi:hypothetical protein
MYMFLSELFEGYTVLETGISPLIGIKSANSVPRFATWDVLQALESGQMSQCRNGTDHLVCAATNVAKALTKSLRDSAYVVYGAGTPLGSGTSNGNVAAGDALVTSTFIRIDWAWMALPGLVWVLGVVSLTGTVWRSKKAGVPTWRDNLLPLLTLYNGGGEEAGPADVRSNKGWEQWAEKQSARLVVDSGVPRLE